MYQSLPKVSIELWRSDAIVLFDWLMSVDLNTIPINHPAEKQALASIFHDERWRSASGSPAAVRV